MNKTVLKLLIDQYRADANEFGLSLEEYLLIVLIGKLDDLHVVSHIADN